MGFQLPRLSGYKIVDTTTGNPNGTFVSYFNNLLKKVENAINVLIPNAQTTADTALADANSALIALGAAADDGLFTPTEKTQIVIPAYNSITGEHTDIDTKATNFGSSVSTQKTAYDTAYTAWVNYMATLTTPVMWNNLSGNTTVDRTTYDTNLLSLKNARQTLLNAMQDRARVVADWPTVTGTGRPADNATKNIVTYASTAPSSPVDGDIWVDTTTGVFVIKVRVSGAWQIGANNVTNTNQVIDGANLGTTATWTGVSGTGKPADNATVNRVTYSASAPSSPVDGDIWVDTTSMPYAVKMRVSGAWQTTANLTTTMDHLGDGATYVRIPDATTVGTGTSRRALIDFSHSHVNRTVDYINDGGTYGRPLLTRLNSGRPLIDFNEPIHTNYGRIMQPKTNLMPYPRGVGSMDSRTPAQLGWGNYAPGNGFTNLFCGSGANWIGGDYYQLSRTSGGAATSVDVFFDVQAQDVGNVFTFSVSGYCTNGTLTPYLQWINPTKTAGVGSTINATYNSVSDRYEATGTMPSGTGWIRVHLACNFASTSGYQDMTFWAIKLEPSGVPTPYHDPIDWISRPGGYRRVGDVRGLPVISGQGARYKYTGTISYTSTAGSGTATISTTAGSSYIGSNTVSYNAMSVGVSGSTGTTVTYYLYLDDPNYFGGSQTLVATTTGDSVYQNDGRAWIGSIDVTFPASGGGTGTGGGDGGGGFGCVTAASWVETQNRGWIRAGQVIPGDMLRCLTEDGNDTEWVECTNNKLALEPSYKITSESGITLRVSHSTPLTLRDNSCIFPAELNGQELPIYTDELTWEPCRAEFAQVLPICRISVHSRVYAAGDVKGRSILTHNLISNPKP